jgi:soluble lytic murein transglycosylase-like protein
MKQRTLMLILLALGLLAAGTTGVVLVMTDWKRKAGDYLALLNAAEDKYGIPRDLLVRQAYQESHFRPDIISGNTVSPAGALGIMQLIPRFYPNIDPLDPAQAIDAAAASMAGYFNQYGTWTNALAAYNDGPGNLNKILAGTKAMPAETQKYISDIIGDVNAAYPQAGIV